MKITWINDWQSLNNNRKLTKFKLGYGFTFFHISVMTNIDPLVNGFSFIFLGLGFRIR